MGDAVFDRDAAFGVLIDLGYSKSVSADVDLVDALAGCVRPVPPQTIDRDVLLRSILDFTWLGKANDANRFVDMVMSQVASDLRFDTIRALHRPFNDGDGRSCNECTLPSDGINGYVSVAWPCATIRALDGEVS